MIGVAMLSLGPLWFVFADNPQSTDDQAGYSPSEYPLSFALPPAAPPLPSDGLLLNDSDEREVPALVDMSMSGVSQQDEPTRDANISSSPDREAGSPASGPEAPQSFELAGGSEVLLLDFDLVSVRSNSASSQVSKAVLSNGRTVGTIVVNIDAAGRALVPLDTLPSRWRGQLREGEGEGAGDESFTLAQLRERGIDFRYDPIRDVFVEQ